MKKIQVTIERFLLSPAHPLLLSIYFVLRVYAHNELEIHAQDLIRPLLISMLATGVFFLQFLVFVRKRHMAAFMASILLVAFYLYDVGWNLLPFKKTFILAQIFASIWVLTALSLIVMIGWKRRLSPNSNLIFGVNMAAVILLLFPMVEIAMNSLLRSMTPPPDVYHAIEGNLPSQPPDIYYIILDAYPRKDVLRDIYEYNNSEFLQTLTDLGFYVAECSQSNYTSTNLSLTSSLNLDYLQNLDNSFRPQEKELFVLAELLDENAVQETVSRMGYKTISFASGFPWAEWRDADVFIAPPGSRMTEFETFLLHSTLLGVLDDLRIVNLDDIRAERFRIRTQLALSSFDELAAMPGPKFVFIHLIIPHSPFAFDEDGNPVAPDEVDSKVGYLNQVSYINKAILPRLQTLIEKSKRPPVILLQGDHGPLLQDNPAAQMKILNAYYLPQGTDTLYSTISPVNSFRVVFNSYFGAEFPLLEDVSYYSDRSKPYPFEFSTLPNTCP